MWRSSALPQSGDQWAASSYGALYAAQRLFTWRLLRRHQPAASFSHRMISVGEERPPPSLLHGVEEAACAFAPPLGAALAAGDGQSRSC
jgi:hypothetical protein